MQIASTLAHTLPEFLSHTIFCWYFCFFTSYFSLLLHFRLALCWIVLLCAALLCFVSVWLRFSSRRLDIMILVSRKQLPEPGKIVSRASANTSIASMLAIRLGFFVIALTGVRLSN